MMNNECVDVVEGFNVGDYFDNSLSLRNDTIGRWMKIPPDYSCDGTELFDSLQPVDYYYYDGYKMLCYVGSKVQGYQPDFTYDSNQNASIASDMAQYVLEHASSDSAVVFWDTRNPVDDSVIQEFLRAWL